jgi:hypothetical protein
MLDVGLLETLAIGRVLSPIGKINPPIYFSLGCEVSRKSSCF